LPGELPLGIEDVAKLVGFVTNDKVNVKGWEQTHNNECWVIKPDSSCGMEVCTPPGSGVEFMKKLCKVIDAFRKTKVNCATNCSLHIHVGADDLSNSKIANVINYWIKAEPVIMDFQPDYRKCNRYCQQIGILDIIEHDSDFTPEFLINKIGLMKYYTINTFHLSREKRRTLEFRPIGNYGCTDPYFVKNWAKFILHFVDRAANAELLMPNKDGIINKWSSFVWIDPLDLMEFLGFVDQNGNPTEVSLGMEQVRDWFVSLLKINIESKLQGVWSKEARKISLAQTNKMLEMFYIKDVREKAYPSNLDDALYNEKYNY